jgi:hypothetical protein
MSKSNDLRAKLIDNPSLIDSDYEKPSFRTNTNTLGNILDEPEQTATVVYSTRWVVLLLFIYASFANATILLTWSPIISKANDYWGGIGDTAVNLLTVSFSIMYIPGSYLASKTLSDYDLRTSMLVAALLQTIGCIIRYVGALARG